MSRGNSDTRNCVQVLSNKQTKHNNSNTKTKRQSTQTKADAEEVWREEKNMIKTYCQKIF